MCDQKTDDHQTGSARDRQRDTGMNGKLDVVIFTRAVVLRDNDAGTAGQTDEETDQQIDDVAARAADCGKRFLADKIADYDRVDRIIKLLKERAEEDRKEIQQHIFRDIAFGETDLS